MSYNIIAPQGTATVTLTAGQKIVVKTAGESVVSQTVGYPNYPEQNDVLTTVVNGTYTSSAFANGGTVIIQSGAFETLYDVGTDPVIGDNGNWQPQGAPVDITDGGSMAFTAASLLGGIVTATPTQARNVQLPLGSALDAAGTMAIGDSFDWTLITLAAFALTITVNTGMTIVGAADTAGTSGAAARFRTRKTAANTFVTYRLS
jgi:hypothetical protein